jgi:hypothetical protein
MLYLNKKQNGGLIMAVTFTTFKSDRSLDINELKEILSLMENQETTDKYVSTSLDINGDDAHILVDIDEDGNVTVL